MSLSSLSLRLGLTLQILSTSFVWCLLTCDSARAPLVRPQRFTLGLSQPPTSTLTASSRRSVGPCQPSYRLVCRERNIGEGRMAGKRHSLQAQVHYGCDLFDESFAAVLLLLGLSSGSLLFGQSLNVHHIGPPVGKSAASVLMSR